jgi:hypothetical protein
MYEIRQNFLSNNHEIGANPEFVDEPAISSNKCNDATLSHPPFNTNQFPAFDQQNQTQGNPGVMTLALM